MEPIDWIVGGVMGFSGLALYAGSKGFATSAKAVEQAEEVSPGPALFERLQDRDRAGLPYAAVAGYVHSSEPSRTLCYGAGNSPCVVKMSTTKEHAKEYSRASNSWHSTTKTVGSSLQFVPLALTSSSSVDCASEPHPMHVHAGEGDFRDVLTKVESKFESADTGMGQSIIGMFSGHKVTGHEFCEEVLPVAQFITVLGKVSLVGKSLVIESPTRHQFILTTESLQDLSERYHGRSRMLGFFAAACFTGLSVYLLYRFKSRLQAWFAAYEERVLRERLTSKALTGAQTRLCIVCLDEPSTMRVRDCGHFCICEDCSTDITRCPACNARVVEVTRG